MTKRALLSVSDKTGIAAFAANLVTRGWEIVSTGGTARVLRNNGIFTISVSEVTGFPEMMDGRLKTLHPLVHGGFLGRPGVDAAVMRKYGIVRIRIVAVNLYPFEDTVAKLDCTFEQANEKIDIGGPAMLRSAAKGGACVICDPSDYETVIADMDANARGLSPEL